MAKIDVNVQESQLEEELSLCSHDNVNREVSRFHVVERCESCGEICDLSYRGSRKDSSGAYITT